MSPKPLSQVPKPRGFSSTRPRSARLIGISRCNVATQPLHLWTRHAVNTTGMERAQRAQGFPMSRNKQHLTDAIVRRFPAPAKGKQIFLDDDVVGFGCRVTAAGACSFILRYITRAGRERTYTIGDATVRKVTTAR